MSKSTSHGRIKGESPYTFLGLGGEMGERFRSFDWSTTVVGPVTCWPPSLKTAVGIMLNSRYPMFIWWGREQTKFYNDAYMPMLGKRHPGALCRPAAEVWSDVRPVVGPQTEAVLSQGRATWNEELLLVTERNQFLEEAYFTFSYSPIPDQEGGVGGLFCAVTEDTQRVLGQRRLRMLRLLAEQAAQAKTAEADSQAAVATLADNPRDVPFALVYLVDSNSRVARLTGMTGLSPNTRPCPATVELEGRGAPWPFLEVARTAKAIDVLDLTEKFGALPGGE